jgi:foldase protein PrsA
VVKRHRQLKTYNAILLVTLLTVAFIGTACSKSEVVASVNGETITKDELYDEMVKQGGQQTLDSIIMNRIIDMEAKKHNIEISEEDVEKEIDKAAEQYGGREIFEQMMAMYGYKIEDMKDDMRLNLKVKALVGPSISILEEEMKEYFEANKEDFNIEEQVKARHILTETEEKAIEVKEKLDAGGDFAEIAKEYSIDDGTKEKGGDLGFVKRGKTVKEFEEAVFSMDIGTISDPVKTTYGYHIIKVEEKQEAQEASYENSKDQVRDILVDDRLPDEFGPWYQKKTEEYKVENFLAKE